ncbi:DUF1905 domain-containing protein [Flavihumibacter sp. CACIAM 22H1]|uniref:DUF1905 domain-containing protein n=1 Tax=Flavihumibacter sp. CACIAM 22H1 TaxID=1812911 RepID=UPI0025C3DFA3|nr:DUF1905 domain-containing protein [Flavihumibacter sp. CACIAM 22H1]
METFKARIELIGINPYVLVPDQLLVQIFAEANKEKGPIPVYGSVNGINYQQTLVKYKGSWRLYINTTMLPDSTKRIGEIIDVAVAFDRRDRTLAMHTGLEKALNKIPAARKIFIQRLLPCKKRSTATFFH